MDTFEGLLYYDDVLFLSNLCIII